ncbi:MAG: protein translocase subunit SecF, partial [Alphaproteobacteria bacterium]|nr:protein translocase subunit SecF [Alphaproteobacteria bacterium]
EWQFGVGAVIALTHDVITTIGLFSLFALEFNLATVAAILTIAGYSINDTVVVYDRVRENLRKYKKMELTELFNRSINETLSRTVMTSVTTLLALMALFLFGGEVIRGFTIALIWGVFVGTYSSIGLAVPLLLYLKVQRGSDEPTRAQEAAS